MLYRTQVRNAALKLITAALSGVGAKVLDSADVPLQKGQQPSIIIYADDHKEGAGSAGAKTFRTTVTLTIQITGEGATADAATTQAEALNDVAETALFGSPDFVALFEAIDQVTTTTDYQGTSGRGHTAFAIMIIEAHATEIFDPRIDTDLTGLNIYVDALNVAMDPNGTYTPPFAYTPTDAPRTAGPDGRAEIAAKIDTPTS